jgi:hypothetical protein
MTNDTILTAKEKEALRDMVLEQARDLLNEGQPLTRMPLTTKVTRLLEQAAEKENEQQ